MALATFEQRINDLVGTFTDESAMDTFLLDGLKEVLSILPPNKLAECTKTTTLSNSPQILDLDTTTIGSVVSVVRKDANGYNQICRPISSALSSRVTDPSDIMHSTASDPVYFINNAVLNVYPDPTASQTADISYVPLPTHVPHGDSDIDNFPHEYEQIVVLYAAIKCAQSLLAIEEDDELYVPIITTLKQDYAQALNLLGAKAEAPKGTGQKAQNPLAAMQEAMQQQQGGQ
jgi:hypothetical protein